MNFLRLSAIVSLSLVSLVSGCKTTWSDADRSAISSVGVSPVGSLPDAYRKPDPTQSPGMATSIPVATGGGLIPALIGSAIDAKVTSKQRKEYEATALQYFDEVELLCEEPPTGQVRDSMVEMLRAQPFFRDLFSEEATDGFSVEITRHGLVRSFAASKERMTLSYEIVANVEFKNGRGKRLLKQVIDGASETAPLIEEIVADETLLMRLRTEAAESFARNLRVVLEAKLGPLPARSS